MYLGSYNSQPGHPKTNLHACLALPQFAPLPPILADQAPVSHTSRKAGQGMQLTGSGGFQQSLDSHVFARIPLTARDASRCGKRDEQGPAFVSLFLAGALGTGLPSTSAEQRQEGRDSSVEAVRI